MKSVSAGIACITLALPVVGFHQMTACAGGAAEAGRSSNGSGADQDDGANEVGVRHSVRQLQEMYENGNKQPLEDLVRAWKGIKDLDPSDQRSFFVLGGYHGEPFEYRPAVDQLDDTDRYPYWGGWCNHGNVLFPTWHRVYCLKVEEALQSIVPTVMLPYWDETSEESLAMGIPWALTNETFALDGKEIANPLRSFVLPEALSDDLPDDDQIWEKPKGYETVRYPLSGLVGTEEARQQTNKHNAQYPDTQKNVGLLNENVIAWLKGEGPNNDQGKGILWQFTNCLRAPNYTTFSNVTSSGQWNLDHPGRVSALEEPHNDVHLAVGGFDVKGSQYGLIAGANGDMGENNTAAMDPIFFFHHCNVDRMFWLWQKQNGKTEKIEVVAHYPGTAASDSQGPTPGFNPGASLSLESPLSPFVNDTSGKPYTSLDCVSIADMGYDYSPGSLELVPPPLVGAKKLVVRVDRAQFEGSFIVRAYASVPGEVDANGSVIEHYLGSHSVFSRRNLMNCANCLTHLQVVAHFSVDTLSEEQAAAATYRIEFQHRGGSTPDEPEYTVEVID